MSRQEKRELKTIAKASRIRPRRQKKRVRGTIAQELIPAAVGDVITKSSRKHTMTVSEQELVGNVLGNTGAAPVVNKFKINPRTTETFPWMSSIALSFELFKFTDLEFIYIPNVGTAEKGSVAVGIDYDPLDSDLDSVAELMAIPGSSTGPAYRKMSVKAVGGGRSLFAKELFLDDSASDNPEVSLGNFYIMVSGTTTADPGVLGQLFVRYTVHLSVQQISASGGALKGHAWSGHFADAATSLTNWYGGGGAAPPVVTTASENFIGWVAPGVGVTGGILFKIPGCYLVSNFMVVGGLTISESFTITPSWQPANSATILNYGIYYTYSQIGTDYGQATFIVNIKVPNTTLQVACTLVNASDWDDMFVLICPLNNPEILTDPLSKLEKEINTVLERRAEMEIVKKRIEACPVKKLPPACGEGESVTNSDVSLTKQAEEEVRLRERERAMQFPPSRDLTAARQQRSGTK